ncbi:MAG: hypothetical protein ACREDR_25620 [Blastocatellia bacterium]
MKPWAVAIAIFAAAFGGNATNQTKAKIELQSRSVNWGKANAVGQTDAEIERESRLAPAEGLFVIYRGGLDGYINDSIPKSRW